MTIWTEDKAWADRFMEDTKAILGRCLLGPPPDEEDREHNTDLFVLYMDPVRIACRVRHNSYMKAFSGEFTLRASRPSGAKTEFAKVIEGWGDYLFYAIADATETWLEVWSLIDLAVFRTWIKAYHAKHGAYPGVVVPNRDGSTFRAFKLADMPEGIVCFARNEQALVEEMACHSCLRAV